MMYVKIMSHEDIPDDDPRKCYHLSSDVAWVNFTRGDRDQILVDIGYMDGSSIEGAEAEGNVYVLDFDGSEITTMGAAPYSPEPPNGEHAGNMRVIRDTLDMMGKLLADHGHQWTLDQRGAYEISIKKLNAEIGDEFMVEENQEAPRPTGETPMLNYLLHVGVERKKANMAARDWNERDFQLFQHYIEAKRLDPDRAFLNIVMSRHGQTITL